LNIAGDIGIFGGGVGGMGEVNILNAATPAHGSPPPGITKAGSEDSDVLLEVELIEDLFA
jgi:hypothetical protein